MIANVFAFVMAVGYIGLGCLAVHDARKMRTRVFWMVPVAMFAMAALLGYLAVFG